MEYAMPGPDMVAVECVDLVTSGSPVPAGHPAPGYAGPAPRFPLAYPAQVTASFRGRAAGSLLAGWGRPHSIPHQPGGEWHGNHLFGIVVPGGAGTVTAGHDHVQLANGEVARSPRVPPGSQLRGTGAAVVGVPLSAITALAEISTGLPTTVQFESPSPVPASAASTWQRTVRFICDQLLRPDVTELSALLVQDLTSVAAAAMLSTFPHTFTTIPDLQDPGWVSPGTVRGAAAFIDAYASQPITLADITQVTGVAAGPLEHAFRRYYATTPVGYLRRIRLERAHAELGDADPAYGPTVSEVARRWGWASLGQFVSSYRRRFGIPPGYTRRLPPAGQLKATASQRETRRRTG